MITLTVRKTKTTFKMAAFNTTTRRHSTDVSIRNSLGVNAPEIRRAVAFVKKQYGHEHDPARQVPSSPIVCGSISPLSNN
jgi:hypothetical protein